MKPAQWALSLLLALSLASAHAQAVDLVRVKKGARKLQLISLGVVIREFNVALGGSPTGHKQREGDQRTPEGRYVLDYKKPDSSYYKAFHISYPNAADVARAKAAGVSPGGQIMIHGQMNGFGSLAGLVQRFDWTDGCVALSNDDMEEVWTLVNIGTPIELLP